MQVLDLSVLLTLVESFLPNVWFNEWGVAQHGYRWTVWNNKGLLEFDVICHNGLWGGSCDVHTSSWGYGGPLTRRCCVHPTLEACITSMWKDFVSRVEKNNSRKVPWFKKAESAYNHFLSLSQEEQLKLFKEVSFYDSID